jgi:DNA-binding protein YbaB
MIQDLTAAAVNAALDAAQKLVQEEMQRLSGGLLATGQPVGGMPR